MNLKPGKINEDNAFNSTLCKVPLEEGSIVIFITLMVCGLCLTIHNVSSRLTALHSV